MKDIRIEGILPNPVSDKATISLSLRQNSKVKMMLTDVNGRLLQSRSMDLNTGSNQINFDLSSEGAGVYHLSLTNGSDKKILKLVKVK